MQIKNCSQNKIICTIAQIRNMLCSDMILSHHLISCSPVARHYLQDCADRYAELEKVAKHVEIGLCTCAWLIG